MPYIVVVLAGRQARLRPPPRLAQFLLGTFFNLSMGVQYEENFHITLAFIGDFGNPDGVMERMETISFQPSEISLGGVSCSDKAWWVVVEAHPEPESLARQIRHVLADTGIPYDKKKFNPHGTFRRRPFYAHGRNAQINIEPVSMEVSCFSLMQSTQGKNSMIYTELGSVEAR